MDRRIDRLHIIYIMYVCVWSIDRLHITDSRPLLPVLSVCRRMIDLMPRGRSFLRTLRRCSTVERGTHTCMHTHGYTHTPI